MPCVAPDLDRRQSVLSTIGMRKILELPINCATCGKAVVLTGQDRARARRRGHGYCSLTCSKAGKSARILAARWPDGRKVLSTFCSNVDCPTPEKPVMLTGKARYDVLRRQRAYCSRACSDSGRAANLMLASWRGDAVGYTARHLRLKEAFGPASAYRCVDCDRQAADWSLNTDVPAELLRADADGQAQGLNFSPYDAFYYPRCRACHRKLDGRGSPTTSTD
jgi:hypothetical protein